MGWPDSRGGDAYDLLTPEQQDTLDQDEEDES